MTLADGRRGRRLERGFACGLRDGPCVRSASDVGDHANDFAQGVSDPLSGSLFSSAAAVFSSLTELLCADESAATDLLRGACDLFAVGLPVRTV